MEMPVQVAVRVCPNTSEFGSVKCQDYPKNHESIPFVQSIPGSSELLVNSIDNKISSDFIQVVNQTFPVTHALPLNCSQRQVYFQAVQPLITLFMEGFDASVVTYGQQGSGKSYALFGVEDGGSSVKNEGIIQQCIREIFGLISNQQERSYIINVGWVEICGEEIRDLLNAGNVPCNHIKEMFHWLQLGLNNRNKNTDVLAHSLFTITLEQQWVTKEGLIQHRLSTASFSDLCSSDRILVYDNTNQQLSLLKDDALRALENIVTTLTDPLLIYRANGNIPYNQTMLTTLLKDSFGGRAQTLLLLCVSPLEQDRSETLYNLQFALKVQCVRNYVIMNTFSDNNTVATEILNGRREITNNWDVGLQFAASQWFKLVSNAEGLFTRLMSLNILNELDKEQIEEWLFLKQECEECLSSNEINVSSKQLCPIREADEILEPLSEPETCQQISDNESDLESQRSDLTEKLESFMNELKIQTDSLIIDKYKEFMTIQPHSVMASQENSHQKKLEIIKSQELEDRRFSSSFVGRRCSIKPGTNLSSAEIAMLNRVAQREQTSKKFEGFIDCSSNLNYNDCAKTLKNPPLEDLQKKLRKLTGGIEARHRQIKEIEHTILLKHKIITDLVKNNDSRNTAKNRFNKKKGKLETEYEKTKRQLSKIIVSGKDKEEIERLQMLSANIKQRLQDLVSIKHIANENGQKVKKLAQSLHESKKIVDELQKKMTKEKRYKEQLEAKLKDLKGKDMAKAINESGIHADNTCRNNLKEVQARIFHLNHVLKEKSDNMEQINKREEQESLRHEIRNLRRTRDHCLEQRCNLDRKLKREKSLSKFEERKLLECDEAIEAIDAAIEFKNELICGRKSIDVSENFEREKGEQMLIERLNKLSLEEMRTLLYKYFTKVIDLRDSSRKLETQLLAFEREKEAWEWKECVLSNAVRQARLEGERNAVLLQRQHETKLTLILRHLAEESSACSSYRDHLISPIALTANAIALPHHTSKDSHQHSPPIDNSQCSDLEFNLEICKANTPSISASRKCINSKQNDSGVCALPDSNARCKEKIRDKEREIKNKLLSKFQYLTRYGGQTSQTSLVANSSMNEYHRDKLKNKSLIHDSTRIPQENIRHLLSVPVSTKVTRKKNKIIILDSTRNS